MPSLPCVTYIYFLLIEKDVCDRRNVSVKLPCVYVYPSFGYLIIFSVRVSSFFSHFCIYKLVYIQLNLKGLFIYLFIYLNVEVYFCHKTSDFFKKIAYVSIIFGTYYQLRRHYRCLINTINYTKIKL